MSVWSRCVGLFVIWCYLLLSESFCGSLNLWCCSFLMLMFLNVSMWIVFMKWLVWQMFYIYMLFIEILKQKLCLVFWCMMLILFVRQKWCLVFMMYWNCDIMFWYFWNRVSLSLWLQLLKVFLFMMCLFQSCVWLVVVLLVDWLV